VVVFASVHRDAFTVTKGAPTKRISADLGERWFCARCGTQLAMRGDDPDLVDFTVASLDDPSSITPRFHIWTERQLPWFQTADELPRHPRSR
jgi:hypothetical protein